MTTENIWDSFSFTEKKRKSALEYLNELKPGLVEQTGGELRLDTESVDAYIDEEPLKLVAIYKLFVVAPKLGNFRRKILTVVEYGDAARFPVDIVNHFSEKKYERVPENDFLNKISEILSTPLVKNSIENLFQQSKENNK